MPISLGFFFIYNYWYFPGVKLVINTTDSGNVDSHTRADIVEYHTKLSTYVIIPEKNKSFQFKLKACNDAFVPMSTAKIFKFYWIIAFTLGFVEYIFSIMEYGILFQSRTQKNNIYFFLTIEKIWESVSNELSPKDNVKKEIKYHDHRRCLYGNTAEIKYLFLIIQKLIFSYWYMLASSINSVGFWRKYNKFLFSHIYRER